MAAENMQNILKEYIAFKIYIQIENVLLNCNNVLLLHFWSNKCSFGEHKRLLSET